MRTKKKIFRGSESTYFRMTSNGTFSKGTVALAVRGEAGVRGRLTSGEEEEERKQERGKKRKQVGR